MPTSELPASAAPASRAALPESPLPSMHYRFERRDFTALSLALSQPSLLRRALVGLGMVLLLMAALLVVSPSSSVPLGARIGAMALNNSPLWVFVVLVFVLGVPLLMRLNAALVYRKFVHAEQDVVVVFTPDGIYSATRDMEGRVGWGMIKRVIETQRHVFLAVSKREALVLPRRAFETPEQLAEAMDFVVAHVPAGTPHILR